MRYVPSRRLISALLPILLTLAFLLVPFSHVRSESSYEYRVTDHQGEVGFVPIGGREVSPVTEGLVLEPGDRLVTGKDGRVEFATRAGTVMELKENSALKVENLSGQVSRFFLRVGRLLGKFAPSSGSVHSYRINTPIAVAAVRGTELAVSVEESGETNAGVVTGEVSFGPTEMEETITSPHPSGETSSDSEAADVAPVQNPDWSAGEVTVKDNGGITIKPRERPQFLQEFPAAVTKDLVWFLHVRERVPHLRERWKDLDAPSKRALRQKALRERITWEMSPRMRDRLISPRETWQKRPAPARSKPERRTPKPRRPNRPPASR